MKELRLRLFAKWCIEHREYVDYEHSGLIERAIIQSKEDTINKIGDLLLEILDMPEEQLNQELNK